MSDLEVPLWFFVATLFFVMILASYFRGEKLHHLEQERDEVLNQLDSARHSVAVLEKRVKTFSEGKKVANKLRIEAETKLAEAVEALTQLVIEYDEVDLTYDEPESMTSAFNVARLITTELKGETDE